MNKVYTVIYTDLGDSCDGFARVLGTYQTKEEAQHKMNADVEDYRKDNGLPYTIDKGDCILLGDEHYGCQWQILEINIETKGPYNE